LSLFHFRASGHAPRQLAGSAEPIGKSMEIAAMATPNK
jgi:hypothetical protein